MPACRIDAHPLSYDRHLENIVVYGIAVRVSFEHLCQASTKISLLFNYPNCRFKYTKHIIGFSLDFFSLLKLDLG